MSKIFNSNRFWIALIIIAALAVSGLSIYSSRSTKLLDKEIYRDFKESIQEAAGTGDSGSEDAGFSDQEELRSFIMSWADSHELEYKTDKYGNIIFNKPAVKRKKNVTPTLVLVSMNYETATDNEGLLSYAAAIAYADTDAGRKTVVFADDEQSLGKGYKGLSTKILTPRSKVIYLDAGSSLYLSTGSFQERFSKISIASSREDNICDTAVKVKISGIKSGVVGPSISKQPDPVSALGTLLARLKSKSAVYRIADLKIGSNGNMYPTSMEATITLNSYAVGSFTSYIDKRIKAWEKAYGKDNPDLEYSYEVIDDPEELPEKTYSAKVGDSLTGILYTLKSGVYRYAESDAVPEDKSVGDVYGINCLLDIAADDDSLDIMLMTQGYNDSFTDRITFDNNAAAELYGCECRPISRIEAFSNDKEALSLNFTKTYNKLNDQSAAGTDLKHSTDNFFTPCSYLAERSPESDIIHIRVNAASASTVANAILYYIKTKGNISIF